MKIDTRYRGIAERIAGAMGDKTLTQAQIAELAGCSRSSACQGIKLLRDDGRMHVVSNTRNRFGPRMLFRLGAGTDAQELSTGVELMIQRGDMLLEHLKAGDHTAEELSKKVSLPKKTINGVMAHLRTAGQAHVIGTRGSLGLEYVYRAGPGKDHDVVLKARPAASARKSKKRQPITIPPPDPITAALFRR